MGVVMQPKVYPLPTGIDLKGKTVIITGGSAGMGLESARQLLTLNASTVILAVRNTTKGETCREELLADSAVKAHNPSAVVKVMEVDMDSYDSIKKFAKAVKAEVPILNLLVLNAGIGLLKYVRSAAGHERTLQVNYLSNVLLTLELLPLLEASAEKSGSQSRITWVGSRTHYNSTFAKKAPIKPDEGVIAHMDSEKFFFPFQKYNDTKLLCVMFMYDLAPRVNKDKVLINMLCPGMVDTNMSDVLPIYLRIPINIVKAIRARPVEQGGWLILHSAVVAGTDSHGEFLLDKDIQPVADYIKSAAGQEVRKKLWKETLEEMASFTTLPPALKAAN